MEELNGYVTQIIYHNSANSYTVFSVNTDEGEITCTGIVPAVAEGESCRVEGEFVEHPVYGAQMKVSVYEPVAPKGREAVLRYLSSGAIKGIGEALARRIVKKFGDDTMRILDEEPERLAEVKGISENGAREIGAQLEDRRDLRDALLFLQQFGISNRQAIRIYERYGSSIYEILKKNPYRLAGEVRGIGFRKADEIAKRTGLQQDSDCRIRSGLLYVLESALYEGSTCLPRSILLQTASTLLQVPEENISLQLDNLTMDRQTVIRQEGSGEPMVYSTNAYRAEQETAVQILRLKGALSLGASEEAVLDGIKEIEEQENIVLDELQRKAVLEAVTENVFLLTGGPGTGKTTAINTIIRFLRKEGKTVLLAAPTGRAARRMRESTGYEAATLHRLLGYRADPAEDENDGGSAYQFDHDRDNPLEADAVIVDEMSMVDIWLFRALLEAISPGTKLIMVGDANQLPSVGPGQVLRDLMDSGAFHSVTLRRIFRQAQQSDIVVNAHRILAGEPIPLDNKSRDFFFLERSSVAAIYKHIVLLMRDMLPGYCGCRTSEIQVLTPMRKGALGAVHLNEVLQSVLNPESPDKNEYSAHECIFREGDKVMQTRNNYQMEWTVPGNFGMAVDKGTGIFNGDFGEILAISAERAVMTVRFDEGRTVEYPFQSLDDLELAYAITVHKSQGSEYPAVIMPLLSGPETLFNRNLLYTAVTRAKKCVVILGRREAVSEMENNDRQNARYTGLCSRIREIQAHDPGETENN